MFLVMTGFASIATNRHPAPLGTGVGCGAACRRADPGGRRHPAGKNADAQQCVARVRREELRLLRLTGGSPMAETFTKRFPEDNFSNNVEHGVGVRSSRRWPAQNVGVVAEGGRWFGPPLVRAAFGSRPDKFGS